MIIKRVRLHNIRSHEDNEFNFDRGITVLSGRTGCGKSSVLMAIEYALFGSKAVSNQTILRRGKSEGYVELEFEEKGDVYLIKRTLKRSKNSISLDSTSSYILKNGKSITLEGRAGDLDKKIVEILGYPEELKPNEVFEITSYTKQDEIRKIVELKAEERQNYIDRILQFSKYRFAYDNLKPLLTLLKSEIERKKALSSELENYNKILKEKEGKLAEIKEKISFLEKEIPEKEKEAEELSEKLLSLEKEYEFLRKKFVEYKSALSKLDFLSKDILKKESELKKVKEEINSLVDESKIFKTEKNYEELEKLSNSLFGDIKALEKEVSNNEEDLRKINELGVGTCPVCKQEVSEEHLSSVKRKIMETIESLKSKISNKKKELSSILSERNKAKKYEELERKIEFLREKLTSLSDEISALKNEKGKLENNLSELSVEEESLEEKKKLLGELREKEKGLSSLLSSLKSKKKLYEEELTSLDSEISSLKSKIDSLAKEKEEAEKLSELFSFLSKLREDIKQIREKVRMTFLEDFRKEFQRKFEELRKDEEEYLVDVEKDYTPVAYTSFGEKVQITNLSGGEKTSLALAYRLALADLASQISSIRQSQLLILDEPTTGLDKEDIKALLEAIQNITTIPQIIIVTHEDELKNAADYKYEIEKVNGKSIISS